MQENIKNIKRMLLFFRNFNNKSGMLIMKLACFCKVHGNKCGIENALKLFTCHDELIGAFETTYSLISHFDDCADLLPYDSIRIPHYYTKYLDNKVFTIVRLDDTILLLEAARKIEKCLLIIYSKYSPDDSSFL